MSTARVWRASPPLRAISCSGACHPLLPPAQQMEQVTASAKCIEIYQDTAGACCLEGCRGKGREVWLHITAWHISTDKRQSLGMVTA